MRHALLLAVVLLAGVLGGSGLAALAHAPPNDACSDFGAMPEGSTSSGSLRFSPLGRACEYSTGGRVVRSESFTPGAGELLAWIAITTALAARGLLRRDSAHARGAVAAAALLALAGAAWQFAGIGFGVLGAAFLGAPLVFAVDRTLRAPGKGARPASALVALALPPIALCSFLVFFFAGVEPLGIAFAIGAGAIVSGRVERTRRARGDLLPSE